MASLPEGFRVVRKRLADGSIKEYRYPTDAKRTPKSPRHPQDSLGALIAAYRISPDYLNLQPGTKARYDLMLKPLEGAAANPAKSLDRRFILHCRDAIAASRGNGAANTFISVVSKLMSWALDRGWVTATPAMKIKMLEIGIYPAWTPEHAAKALAELTDEPLRRAVVLGLHTGQRRGDLIKMLWTDIQGSSLHVIQEKTGAELLIPIHETLGAELAAWRKDAKGETILQTTRGRPWIDTYLSHALSAALQAIGLPAGLNVHGMRKLVAANLAQAGCSTHEIAAITGHKSLGMVAHYTRSVSQKHLAKAAVLRLHQPEKTTDEEPGKPEAISKT